MHGGIDDRVVYGGYTNIASSGDHAAGSVNGRFHIRAELVHGERHAHCDGLIPAKAGRNGFGGIFDDGGDARIQGGRDIHLTGGVDAGILGVGLTLSGIFLGNIGANQRIHQIEENILRIPADGVEGQHNTDGVAV